MDLIDAGLHGTVWYLGRRTTLPLLLLYVFFMTDVKVNVKVKVKLPLCFN
jgi:hypothetical protein